MINKLKDLFYFLKDIVVNKKLIYAMAKNDFKVRYAGSYLGITWAFIQPIITILLYWFVFQVGFRAQAVGNYPFILWLIGGMIPWFFFSEAWSSATNCLIEYSYLVKKVVFRISILPIVKIISSLFVHLAFIIIMIIILLFFKFPITIQVIQVFYYLFAMTLLVIALSWITSAFVVFFRDTVQILNIILQFGFWLTPIGWSETMIPKKYELFFKLNPFFYIVQGYRETFIEHKWFWGHMYQTYYFWGVILTLFIGGALFFGRLRPHFSDVL